MKYFTNNDMDIYVGGTYLIGYINISYNMLVKKFGNPTDNYDNYKSDAAWDIKFENGLIATIYNYKDGKNYCGEAGTPIKKIKEWHVGGKEPLALIYVVAALRSIGNEIDEKQMEFINNELPFFIIQKQYHPFTWMI